MNIRNRLVKLEAAAGINNKPLFEMSDSELERFLTEKLGLPKGTPMTDDMLWEIINDGKTVVSRYTHEERLDMLEAEEREKA
jgi:hypothetical protein